MVFFTRPCEGAGQAQAPPLRCGGQGEQYVRLSTPTPLTCVPGYGARGASGTRSTRSTGGTSSTGGTRSTSRAGGTDTCNLQWRVEGREETGGAVLGCQHRTAAMLQQVQEPFVCKLGTTWPAWG